MTNRKGAKTTTGAASRAAKAEYKLRLYVAGQTEKSLTAFANRRSIILPA